MKFRLRTNPFKQDRFELNPRGGKFKTAEIEPFCLAHDIPMYDSRKVKETEDGEIVFSNYHPYSDIKEFDYIKMTDGGFEIIKMELTDDERYTLYDGFEIKQNSKGWFMVYRVENISAYLDYKYNKGVEK